jgi:hypothetical protein
MASQHDFEKGVEVITSARTSPAPKTADPAALGLFAFASTTFILSLYNVGARGISHPNVVLGMAAAMGGLAQLLAGMWEFPRGNTFGATAFTSYGAFWISYALIITPGTGIIAAYGDNAKELDSALGIYLMAWFIITTMFFIGALRKNVAFIALFFCLLTTFLLLGAGALTGVATISTAGGGVGILTAFIAFYCGLSVILANEESPIFKLPLGVIGD